MKHTPTPWIDNGNEIVSEVDQRNVIAGAITDADNEYIVKCVNSHDDLVTALQEISTYYTNGFPKKVLDLGWIAKETLKKHGLL